MCQRGHSATWNFIQLQVKNCTISNDALHTSWHIHHIQSHNYLPTYNILLATSGQRSASVHSSRSPVSRKNPRECLFLGTRDRIEEERGRWRKWGGKVNKYLISADIYECFIFFSAENGPAFLYLKEIKGMCYISFLGLVFYRIYCFPYHCSPEHGIWHAEGTQ